MDKKVEGGKRTRVKSRIVRDCHCNSIQELV